MTEFEPYVADPAERPPPPRLVRWRPWVAAAIVAILGANVVLALGPDGQDPSLDAPGNTFSDPPPIEDRP